MKQSQFYSRALFIIWQNYIYITILAILAFLNCNSLEVLAIWVILWENSTMKPLIYVITKWMFASSMTIKMIMCPLNHDASHCNCCYLSVAALRNTKNFMNHILWNFYNAYEAQKTNLKVLFIITSKYQKRFELSSSHTIFSFMLTFLGCHCSDDQRLVSNSYACINESIHSAENPFVFFSWQWPELKLQEKKKIFFFFCQIDLRNGYIMSPP